MPIPFGMQVPALQIDRAEIEASLLGALIKAETTREGARSVLTTLVRALGNIAGPPDADPMALAVRDRDGISLHVLAQCGLPRMWPRTLDPRFSVGALSGVDATTGAVVIPLRSNGRVAAALLVIDAIFASAIQRDPAAADLLQTAALVLEELVSRTDAIVTRRAKSLRSVESILEGIAHQIANPLTGASAIAQLLAEEITDEGQRAAVRQIVFELSRAAGVLRDLSDFQRQTGAHAGVLDLNAIVEGVGRFRGYAIREQGIALEVQTLTQAAQVRVDGQSLEHALLLLLRFAEIQSRESGKRSITLRVAERDTGEYSVEINHSGPRTQPDLASTYFDLPFRDESQSAIGDSDEQDLGLAENILRRAGGRIEARDGQADEAILALVLPRAVTGNYSLQGRTI